MRPDLSNATDEKQAPHISPRSIGWLRDWADYLCGPKTSGPPLTRPDGPNPLAAPGLLTACEQALEQLQIDHEAAELTGGCGNHPLMETLYWAIIEAKST